ncbi:hypothetical protein MPLDJ20_20644 [Mesorhizobium plurifarium]|uniref:Uncharacterized protein n=1 Tax=Mesorhizobium plurifarium TaxID=69974 RepID=A0A090EYS7_MESPL|nr:hypothetical protein MPLDJ20_20644 [Mesorhizobium plurifarium]CDX50841.1 hypothetical protein MPL3365_130170 [Mesorhizobium plurifarium]
MLVSCTCEAIPMPVMFCRHIQRRLYLRAFAAAAAQIPLSENPLCFQRLTSGHPQLVQRTVEQQGRSSCQENYFRIFRFRRPFSYSPEKGLNHNGFVKTGRPDSRFQAPFGNQIR